MRNRESTATQSVSGGTPDPSDCFDSAHEYRSSSSLRLWDQPFFNTVDVICFGQVVTTVIVDQMNQPGATVRNVKGTEVLTVGIDLIITFLDQNGEPIVGTVSESVDPGVIQATEPVPLDQGRDSDLVSNSLGSVPQTVSEQQAALQKLNQNFTTDQTITFTVVPTSGPPATVTQKRSLTNTTPSAPPIAGGAIKGYTFKMEPPKIKVP
jgi:hypothetical protein